MRSQYLSLAATAVAGALIAGTMYHSACQQPAALDADPDAAPGWIVRAATSPPIKGVRVATIRFAGFDIGEIVAADEQADTRLAKWHSR